MENLILHYLNRLEETSLTEEQRKLYEGMVDEYSLLFLQELYE